MKEYTFENALNTNIRIIIKAYNHFEALDLLRYTVPYTDDYRLLPDEEEMDG